MKEISKELLFDFIQLIDYDIACGFHEESEEEEGQAARNWIDVEKFFENRGFKVVHYDIF